MYLDFRYRAMGEMKRLCYKDATRLFLSGVIIAHWFDFWAQTGTNLYLFALFLV